MALMQKWAVSLYITDNYFADNAACDLFRNTYENKIVLLPQGIIFLLDFEKSAYHKISNQCAITNLIRSMNAQEMMSFQSHHTHDT